MSKLSKRAKLSCLFLLFFGIGLGNLAAQNFTVTGTVTDENQETLIGVNILVEGTPTGTVTDIDGNYRLELPDPNSRLVFSYTGYADQIVAVNARSNINVILLQSASTLNEVVVIGYGEVSKRDLTGAVSSVKSEELDQLKPISFESGLAARAAGVQVVTTQGGPGESVKIRIRGGTSINASNDPLYVIDGFAIEGSAIGTGLGIGNSSTSPLAGLDPSSIESVEVLKDASATAIYGSRGANGVILITTKKGRKGKTELDFETFQSFGNVARPIELLTGQEYVDWFNEFAPWNPNDPTGQFVGSYRDQFGNDIDLNDPRVIVTNWQDEVMRTSSASNYRLSLRGGTDKSRLAGAVRYLKQDGIIQSSDFERVSANLNFDQDINDRLKAGVNISLGANTRNGVVSAASENANGRNGIITSAILFSPVQGLTRFNDAEYDENGRLVSLRSGDINNPNLSLNGNTNQTREIQSFGNVFVSYRLARSLTFKSAIRANFYSSKGQAYYSERFGWGQTANGRAFTRANNSGGLTYEQSLSYNQNFKNHKVNAVAVYEQQESFWESLLSRSTGFNLPGVNLDNLATATETLASESTRSDNALQSFLGRVNYTFKDKYILTLSGRYDGSSRFAEGAKWGFFPSAALAWRLGDEAILKDSKVLSDAKIKVSYGETGNTQIGSFRSLPAAGFSSYIFAGDVLTAGISTNRLANPGLTWETTSQADVGLSLSFFDYRFNLNVDYYNKDTRDLLLEVPLPGNAGYDFSFQNLGKVRNEGLEIAFTSTNITSKNFRWSTNFNISFNQNTVLDLGDADEFFVRAIGDNQINNDYVIRVGESLGSVFGHRVAGVYNFQDFVEFDGMSDADAAAKMRADAKEMGIAYYDIFYTLKDGVVTTGGSTQFRPGMPKFVDTNGDGIVNDDDRTIIGNTLPKHFGGLTNNFSYKNIDLSVLVSWSYGNDIYNKNLNKGNAQAIPFFNKYRQVRDRWTPDNPNTNIPGIWGDGDGGFTSSAYDTFLEDGSFVRLSNITLGYNLPRTALARIGFRSLRVYASADNLYVWTNYTGYDPEVSVGFNQLTPGLDVDSYPRQRTFRFGLNVGL